MPFKCSLRAYVLVLAILAYFSSLQYYLFFWIEVKAVTMTFISLHMLSGPKSLSNLSIFVIKIWIVLYDQSNSQGITNTVGAVPGIVGVALTGYLLDSTHSWSVSLTTSISFIFLHIILNPLSSLMFKPCLALVVLQTSLFVPSVFFYLTGTIVWLVFASSKPQNFSNRN